MSWFSKLLGADKALASADKLINHGAAGIDKLFFTKEEKAEAAQGLFNTWVGLQNIIADESTIRSITRRRLAVMLIGLFVVLMLITAVMIILNHSNYHIMFSLATSDILLYAVVSIIIFYFGPYAISKGISMFKSKLINK